MVNRPNAFDGVIDSPIQGRLPKPRQTGHSMVIDKGLGLLATGELLEMAGEYIEYIKFTFGTAALYDATLLRAKIDLIKSYGVAVYPGGTFLEIAVTQNALSAYLQRASDFGFTHIEVSDGTIDLPAAQRLAAIHQARELGFPVITEVGKKDGTTELDPEDAIRQIEADLAAGAVKVIIEGRESGKGAGVFDRDGKVKADDIMRIGAGVMEPGALMWEAPLKAQQEELICRFGPNVNLGNVQPDEVLALEALRRGLRGDTLRHALVQKGTSHLSQ